MWKEAHVYMRCHQGAKCKHFDVSDLIYHRFSHGAASYTLNGERGNVMLEFFLFLIETICLVKTVQRWGHNIRYICRVNKKLSLIITKYSLLSRALLSCYTAVWGNYPSPRPGTSQLLMTRKTSKFGEFISPAEVALVCLKFKFHKILFTCH